MAQVVRFWPKVRRLDPSDYQIEKWHRSLVSKNLAERSRYSSSTRFAQKYEYDTQKYDYEYNHDARTQSPRLTAARLQLAVGRRGLGPREQGEQCTQHASFVVRIMREYTQSSCSSGAALGCFVEKKTA